MSLGASTPLAGALFRTLLRIWRDPAAWMVVADVIAALIALALPWSTSLVAIFAAAWIVVIAWIDVVVLPFDITNFSRSLKQPACLLPIALFALAAVGMLWSDAPWGARIYAVGPTVKFLMLPPLIYHFERSRHGLWVFAAFLVSCALLMAMSWIVAFYPELTIKPHIDYGVPVKNYIDQSQEFALCAVALAYPVFSLLQQRKFALAALVLALGLSFVVNMLFVIVSRTAMIGMPVMLVVFALLHLKWRGVVIMLCAMAALAGAAWLSSPHLRAKAMATFQEYDVYEQVNGASSIGLRMEFWKKSFHFFAEAPLIGHGTGSTRGLFEQAAAGQTGTASAEVIGNPHNQTLNVAVQWGMLGVVVLYAMWLVHFLLFRGDGLASWLGLLVVVQNVMSSLFNSHLFDFHEGWMYVLGVGVAGGMVLGGKRASCSDAVSSSLQPSDDHSLGWRGE
jgi:O-antigen ligase